MGWDAAGEGRVELNVEGKRGETRVGQRAEAMCRGRVCVEWCDGAVWHGVEVGWHDVWRGGGIARAK